MILFILSSFNSFASLFQVLCNVGHVLNSWLVTLSYITCFYFGLRWPPVVLTLGQQRLELIHAPGIQARNPILTYPCGKPSRLAELIIFSENYKNVKEQIGKIDSTMDYLPWKIQFVELIRASFSIIQHSIPHTVLLRTILNYKGCIGNWE